MGAALYVMDGSGVCVQGRGGSGPNPAEVQPEEAPMEEEEEDEEEEVAAVHTQWEQEFNFTEYLMGYAKPEILKAYVLLAADFEKNSAHANHCVVKMLHRIGFDLGFMGMLFQASLFRVFQRLMHGALARSARFQELYKFGIHVVRRFSEVAEKNKKVFMEMLFWKGSKEAMQITEGYDYNPSTAKVSWTENDENELMRLFEDFRDAQNPEKDVVDLIMEQWSGANKTRGQIIRQLKNLGLIESVKDIKKKPQSNRVWTTEDEQELELVYQENKETDDPLSNIIMALSKKRSKNKVAEKLLAMGLVTDRKELYKKRRGKGQGGRRQRGRKTDSDEDEDGEREEDGFAEEGDSDDEDPREGSLPSDEEILSSPSVSCASSDDDDSSDDDGDEDVASERTEAHQHEEQGASTSSSSASSGLVEMMKNIVDKGYKEQVCWIHKLLTQNANTREGQDKIFSVPIVPLTEENETAMEDPVFMDFLRGLGLSPPANEQEMFWRIPAELTAPDLRAIAQAIELDDDGEPLNPEMLSGIQRSKQQLVSTKDKKKKDRKKDKKKKKKKKQQDNRAGKKDKKKRKADKEKERGRKKKKVDADRKNDSDDNDQASVSDNDDGDKVDNKSDNEEDAGRRKGSKMSSAVQRREALKAMLERRKVKKVLNRKRKRSRDTSGKSDDDETTEAEQRIPAESIERVASLPSDGDMTPSEHGCKSKKRVKRVVDSDSDSDDDGDRLVIDQDKASSHASPTKPTRRIRLLDSDLSDNNDDKESMDTSALSYKSDQDASASQSQPQSQSQSQSQGFLDFGDSDENDDDKTAEKRKEKGDDDEGSSDDNLPLTNVAKRKANVPESFPATLFSQGTPDSEDSELDDHVPLGVLKKGRKIISDDDE